MIKPTFGAVVNLTKINPVSDDLEKQIKNSFYDQYVEPVKVWALTNKDKKRKILGDFLRGKPHPKFSNTPRSIRTAKNNDPDFLLTTFTGSIDVNQVWSPRISCKKSSERIHDSSIKDQEIFGPKTTYNSKKLEPDGSLLIHFYAKKLFLPEAYKRLQDVIISYTDLIKELSQFLTRDSNYFPSQKMVFHPTIGSFANASLIKKTNKEDHMFKNTYVHTLPQSARQVQRSYEYKPVRSTYRDEYDPQLAWGGLKPELTKMIKPPAGNCPIVRIDDYEEIPDRNYTRADVMEQYNLNSTCRRGFYRLANSKTVL